MIAEHTDVTKDKLFADLKVVVTDAEELLHVTAAQAGEKAVAARARIQESLKVAKEKFSEAETIATAKAKAAAHATDDYVHKNPWTSIGIGSAVGLVIGLLISRR
jgi:ElaB/YqjD/DUF883 family membrane-anchored ribosome-binding protein